MITNTRNITSLDVPSIADIYLKLNDKHSKKSFMQTCALFYWVKFYADCHGKTLNFIEKNYELIEKSSSIKELTISSLFRCNVMFLSEVHICENHRVLNSQLVSMLWRQNYTEVYLEAEDDQQIKYAPEIIKKEMKCWDINKSFLDSFLHHIHFNIQICDKYLNNLTNERLDFAAFLKCYKTRDRLMTTACIEGLGIDYSIERVENICNKGVNANEPLEANKCKEEIIKILLNEVNQCNNFLQKKIESVNHERNCSLTDHAMETFRSGKTLIFVAGHAHVISRHVQLLAQSTINKKFGMSCISLKPKSLSSANETSDSGDQFRLFEDVANCLDSETNFWSEMVSFIKQENKIQDDNERNSLIISNEKLISSLKIKLKEGPSITDFSESVFCLLAVNLIYSSELINLDKWSLEHH